MSIEKAKYITDPDGKKKAVILSVREYNRLLEDLHDLGVIAERREEDAISLSELQQRLQDHA